jgi:alpha-galactosidase
MFWFMQGFRPFMQARPERSDEKRLREIVGDGYTACLMQNNPPLITAALAVLVFPLCNCPAQDLAPPQISQQPISREALKGESVSFEVRATGQASSFQWLRDGKEIAGATEPTLTLPYVKQLDDGARFSVDINNRFGEVSSAEATLSVTVSSASWDLAGDWSFDENPNGVWTQGWADRLGGKLNQFGKTWGKRERTPIHVWCDVAPDLQGWVGFKVTDDGFVGWGNWWNPGVVLMMAPGAEGPDAKTVARWTSPVNGTVRVNAEFTCRRHHNDDGGQADVHVLHNAESVHSSKVEGFVGARPIDRYDEATATYHESIRKGIDSWKQTIQVEKGDTIDFVAGMGTEFHYNGVGVKAHVDLLPDNEGEDEQQTVAKWAASHLAGKSNEHKTSIPPFSFSYDGKPSSELLSNWIHESSSRALDSARTEHIRTFSDPGTGLTVTCRGIEYHDYPTVEWVVWLENRGDRDTPIIEKLEALDLTMRKTAEQEFVLHRVFYRGPNETIVQPGRTERVMPYSIFAMTGTLPFTNVELRHRDGIRRDAEGMIAVVAWPTLHQMAFARPAGDAGNSLRITGGQLRSHFKLHPGEKVRTALIVLQFWKGSRAHGQNVWRRWMFAHNIPKDEGKPLGAQFSASSSSQFQEMMGANEKNQIEFIDRYEEEKLGLDFWWMDAGWYPPNTHWGVTGTWEVDRRRFPNGLRAITDHARQFGIQAIVWFQPVRITPGTRWHKERSEFLWPPADAVPNYMFNFGNPKAVDWVVKEYGDIIESEGIKIHRMDANLELKAYFLKQETADRQGVLEMKWVQGYLDYMDKLSERFPHLRHDHHRLDLETLRRAAPLILTVGYEPVSDQCHNAMLAPWVPWHGISSNKISTYDMRSLYAPAIVSVWDVRDKSLEYDLARKLLAEWRQVLPNFWGDHYLLTPFSRERDVWMASQYHRAEDRKGMVQAFRRAENKDDSTHFRLHGLERTAKYKLTDLDKPDKPTRATGAELMDQGLFVRIGQPRSAVIVTYEKD